MNTPRNAFLALSLVICMILSGLMMPLAMASEPAPVPTAQPPQPHPNLAITDMTLSANTWWTTSITGQGANDSTTFANRKPIPFNIGSLIVNVNVNLTLVLEGVSGALVNGTGNTAQLVLGGGAVAAKTFTCYGGLYCVDGSNVFNKASTIRCAIGGTTGFKEGQKVLFGPFNIFNIDWGQQSDGTATGNVVYSFLPTYPGYGYNCSYKEFKAGNGMRSIGNSVWESSTFYGSNNGADKVFYNLDLATTITLIACTQVTTHAYWMVVGAGGLAGYNNLVTIVGGITKGGAGGASVYLYANSILKVQHYRRAYVKTTSDGTTALAGVAFSAYEATATGIDQPQTAGITGASGLCIPKTYNPQNTYIDTLQKVEVYQRATAGAMTWGTPTYTNTYGQYTYTFSKSGYDTATYTRAMTTDWGTLASPIAITMNATAPYLPPGLCDINPFYTYEDGTYAAHKVNYTNGENMFAQGRFTWNNDISDVLCNATLYSSPTATPLKWWNASYDFLANTTTSTDTIFGIGLSYDTGNAGNGSFYLVVTFWNSTIETTSLAVQYAVLPALVPGFQYDNYMLTYDSTGTIPQANFTWSSTCQVYFTYLFESTHDLIGDYTNFTVQDLVTYTTVLWISNTTLDFMTGIQEGGNFLFNINTLDNGTYLIVATIEHPDLVVTTFATGFVVMAHNLTGAMGDFYIRPCDSSTYAIERGNYTLGELVYPDGYVMLTESLTNAAVNVSVWSAATAAWVQTIYTGVKNFAQYGGYALPTMMGAPNSVDTATLGIGNYWLEWSITDTEIGGTNAITTTATFTVSLPRTAYMNVSAYSSNTTNYLNLTNRVNASQIIYFNGTIGAIYSVTAANINISVFNTSSWLETLWAGTYTFTGGVNASLTAICGDVLNYTNATEGDYRVQVTVNLPGVLNQTTITEGFRIQNMTGGGSVPALPDPGFPSVPGADEPIIPTITRGFWDNLFLGAIIATANNWFPLMFLFVLLYLQIWMMLEIRKKRRAN
jgi:hypothetical protein